MFCFANAIADFISSVTLFEADKISSFDASNSFNEQLSNILLYLTIALSPLRLISTKISRTVCSIFSIFCGTF